MVPSSHIDHQDVVVEHVGVSWDWVPFLLFCCRLQTQGMNNLSVAIQAQHNHSLTGFYEDSLSEMMAAETFTKQGKLPASGQVGRNQSTLTVAHKLGLRLATFKINQITI